jgi:hypothetical protein
MYGSIEDAGSDSIIYPFGRHVVFLERAPRSSPTTSIETEGFLSEEAADWIQRNVERHRGLFLHLEVVIRLSYDPVIPSLLGPPAKSLEKPETYDAVVIGGGKGGQDAGDVLGQAELQRSKHIISSFDAALDVLKNDVLMMSSLTDQNFQTAIEALLNRDRELCNQVIADDEEVDILEKQVDQDGVNPADSLSSSGLGYERGYLRDEG